LFIESVILIFFFARQEIWRRYVVDTAIDELTRILGTRARAHPTLLDAGCGAGRAFPTIAARLGPDRIVAVDIDRSQLVHAEEEAKSVACAVEVMHGDLRRLDIGSASIDVVLCHQALHHTEDQVAVLREFRRVLRPDGLLLIAESCRRFIDSLPVRLLFRHPKGVQRSPDGYLSLLRSMGFEFASHDVAKTRPFWSEPDFGLRMRLGFAPHSDREATELHVVARRAG